MKFCHFSDTHLGFNAYRKMDPNTGLNQREVDIANIFEKAVDEIIKINPDFVLHTGDLFDSYRPANRVVTFALKQLLRLAEKTKVYIISGNHSTPRTANYGSVFELFDFFPELNIFYKGKYESVKIGDTFIHAVPHCLDNEHFHAELSKIKIEKDSYNILAVHCGVEGMDYSMDDFGETLMPQKYLDMDFDYIALGHYHKMARLNDKAYYCGSPERFSFNEADDDKGFIVYNLENKQAIFKKLPARQMNDFSIDCNGLKAEKLNNEIDKLLKEASVKGKIIRLKLDNLDKETYREIDNENIKKLTSDSVQFSLSVNLSEETGAPSLDQEIGNINQEFVKFTKAKNLSSLADIGLSYLNKASENETD
jgi:exonuclease SbcD